MSGKHSEALELNAENVHDLFRYERESGKLFWKKRGLEYFATGPRQANAVATWNSRHAGTEITSRDAKGYIHTRVFGKPAKAHRIIWLLVRGRWPDQIDHINGDKSDNRIENLRDVTNQQNQRNTRRPSDNTSGVVGVMWNKKCQKWRAVISVDGRKKHLGLFDIFEEAVSARRAAEARYGFHTNHGRG